MWLYAFLGEVTDPCRCCWIQLRPSARFPVGDCARVERTDPAGVGLFGALVVGRDILYGVVVAASAGAAFAGHISSLHQHFGTYGRFMHC